MLDSGRRAALVSQDEDVGMSLAERRSEYTRGGLEERDLDPDPILQFGAWFAEAEAAGVPVRRDEALVGALAGLELGNQVPEELWAAVAEALAWAYRLDTRKARRGAR